MESVDLHAALENRVPYSNLPPSLRQRLKESDYGKQAVRYAIRRCYAYHRLPDFVRTGTTEKEYYEEMIRYGGECMQLFPYAHQKNIVFYTRETPLSYYVRMLGEMLKNETRYDRLPNFTALDILRLLGIGRNQYLNLTKEVCSKLRWHVNRSFVHEHLPTSLLPSVSLDPFWRVECMPSSPELLRKLSASCSQGAVTLYKFLVTRGGGGEGESGSSSSAALGIKVTTPSDTFYVCQLPKGEVIELFRHGAVFVSFQVSPEDRVRIPPLDNFVMNRTSDDPQEVLLYKVLSTADETTPMSLLAQLLLLEEADVCAAAEVLIRLGLAIPRQPTIPEIVMEQMETTVHASWSAEVTEVVTECRARGGSTEGETGGGGGSGGGHPPRRIAFLYDATLTGFLMMTNLSKNPLFKQNAVTLFEVGKLSDTAVGDFLDLLSGMDTSEVDTFSGEAQRYIHSALCLREVLQALRVLRGPDGEEGGVDMIKIESLNELEATTRYSLLGRHYWAYVITSPASCSPLVDMELQAVYGSTVSLMVSPWLLLFLYAKTGRGPLSLLVPFGTTLRSWPPEWRAVEQPSPSHPHGAVAKLRLQAMTLDAQVSHADLDHCLLLLNEVAETAPVFVQCDALRPIESRHGLHEGLMGESHSFKTVELDLPFLLPLAEVKEMIVETLKEREKETEFLLLTREEECEALESLLTTSANALHVEHSLGYFSLCLAFHTTVTSTGEGEKGKGEEAEREDDATATKVVSLALQTCYVTGIGLGMPLTNIACCSRLIDRLPSLLTSDEMEKHNASMRQCVSEFSEFLETYTTLSRQVHEGLALQSVPTAGPMTSMHLRPTGTSQGAPYPPTIVCFDGKTLKAVDDLNPLSELW